MATALAWIALAALLGLAIHLCIYRLIEAISRAWIDAQGLRHGGDQSVDLIDGDIRPASLLSSFHENGPSA